MPKPCGHIILSIRLHVLIKNHFKEFSNPKNPKILDFFGFGFWIFWIFGLNFGFGFWIFWIFGFGFQNPKFFEFRCLTVTNISMTFLRLILFLDELNKLESDFRRAITLNNSYF